MSGHVLDVQSGQMSCRVHMNADFSIREISQPQFPAVSLSLQRLLTAGDVAVESRARLGGVDHLNCTVFPLTPPSGIEDYGRHYGGDAAWHDEVTTLLAQGPGFAVRPSRRYQALTAWWVDEIPAEGPVVEDEVVVMSEAGFYRATTTTMRSFSSATSRSFSPAVIRMIGIPYRVLDGWATGTDCVGISFGGGTPFAGDVTFDVARKRVVRTPLEAVHQVPAACRTAVTSLPWEARTLPSIGMVFTVDNHPIAIPPISMTEAVVVPRSGRIKEELLLSGPGYAASTSPTINCLSVYWLSERDEQVADATATLDETTTLPCNRAYQRVFRSLTSKNIANARIDSLQVALPDLVRAAETHGALRATEPEAVHA